MCLGVGFRGLGCLGVGLGFRVQVCLGVGVGFWVVWAKV